MSESKDYDDGVYAVPGEYRTKLRKLIKYCESRGIKPVVLTDEEWKQLVVHRKSPLLEED